MQLSSLMTIIARAQCPLRQVKKIEAMPARSFSSGDSSTVHRVMQDAPCKFLADLGFACNKTKSFG